VPDFRGKTHLGFSLETTIDRSEFDLLWNPPRTDGEQSLSTDVTMTVDLDFVLA
jgi:hypothetical protein